MATSKTIAACKKILKDNGWAKIDELSDGVWEQLEAESAEDRKPKRESVLRYVSTFYDAYTKDGRYLIITDGAEFVTVNAELMMVVSASEDVPTTRFYTIGGSTRTILNWLAWAAGGRIRDNCPDYGFNYVS